MMQLLIIVLCLHEYNATHNYNHDFLILQMSDAMDEATFLPAA